MQAFLKIAPGNGNMGIAAVPAPVPQPGEALVRIAASGICGTDVLVHDDRYQGRNRPMPYPLVVGHEAAGVVVDLGPGTAGPAPGMRVGMESMSGCGQCFHCLRGNYNLCQDWHHIGLTRGGALAEFVAVPVASLLALPDDVSFASAAFLEPMSVALHFLERARPAPGLPAAILGPGPLGLLHLQVLQAAGLGPILVFGQPGDEARLAVARLLGAAAAVVADHNAVREQVAEVTGGLGMAVVVEAAGTPAAVQTALDIAGGKGTVVITGLSRSAVIDPLSIMRKDLTVLGVVGGVKRHFAAGIRLIQTGRVQPERLITHRLGLTDALSGLLAMRDRQAVKVMVTPGA